MERIIITGGTGLIGSALAKQLAKNKYEVIVLSRNPAKTAEFASVPNVKVVKWDGVTGQGWAQFADGAFGIVNLAGENISAGRWTAARKRAIVESRLNAGKAVVDAVSQANVKPRVVIQSSAIGFYGSRGDEIITEIDKPGTTFEATTSIAWEKATDGVKTFGVRHAIIRTGVVLSPQGGALPQMLLPFKLFAGGPIGSGRQYFSWIHLQDEVNAIQFLLENEQATGIFNLTAPNPVTNKEFAQAIGHVLRRPSFFPVPAFALQLMFGEMSSILLGGQRVVPSRLQEIGFKFQFNRAVDALHDLL